MGCEDGISKSIVSDCTKQPIAGVEIKAWVGNRKEATFTYDATNPSKVTSVQMAVGSQLFTITGVKKLLNPKFSLVTAEDRADKWQQGFNFQGFEFDCASVENIDALKDLFVIVEMKDKPEDADGTFRGFGFKNGLYKTSDEWTANDIDGARAIEIANQEGEEEPHSNYTVLDTDYATTLAMLEAQEVVQV